MTSVYVELQPFSFASCLMFFRWFSDCLLHSFVFSFEAKTLKKQPTMSSLSYDTGNAQNINNDISATLTPTLTNHTHDFPLQHDCAHQH